MKRKVQEALLKWKAIAGVSILSKEEATNSFGQNTLGIEQSIEGAIVVTTPEHVVQVITIAHEYHVPLYPISGGHNWGYGSALPVNHECFILDLSTMNRIIEVNEKLGYMRIEPGVTQGQLYDYFLKHNLPFMVPTTGAGPLGSLIGNALDKGFGITPHEDHFGAVLSLKAVLPNGKIYTSTMNELGGYVSDTLFKWKIGAYMDGLFVQGNAGVVVEATIALARKPESMTQFLIFVNEENFKYVVEGVARTKRRLGSMVGGINIMNKHRLLSMLEPKEVWQGDGTLTEVHIQELAKKRSLPDWMIMGGIYGPASLHASIKSLIKKEFEVDATRIIFLNAKRIKMLLFLVRMTPFSKLRRTIEGLRDGLEILEGKPSVVALPLAYLKNPAPLPQPSDLSLHVNECGLMWFAPLLPADGKFVMEYVSQAKKICVSHDIEPLVTLTTLSERCFDATIPIVFNKSDKESVQKAHACYKELLEYSKSIGVFPYRTNVETMRDMFDGREGASFEMLTKIKNAIDPHHIISPGRYGKIPSKE